MTGEDAEEAGNGGGEVDDGHVATPENYTAGSSDELNIKHEHVENINKDNENIKGDIKNEEEEELARFSEYTFQDMEFKDKILNELRSKGIEKCTQIQAKMIPQIIYGRNVFCVAPVGTGKTTAYVLTLLQRIDPKFQHTQLLITTMTHAIAAHISATLLSVFCPLLDLSYCFVEDGMVDPKKAHSHIVIGSTSCLHDTLTKKRLELTDVKTVVFHGADFLFSDEVYVATCANYRDCPKTMQVICVCNEFPKPDVERHLKFFGATYLSSDFFQAVIPPFPGTFPRVRSHLWLHAKPGTLVDELFRFLREEPSVVGRKVIVMSTKLHDCEIAFRELEKKGYACTLATLQFHKTKSAQIVQHFRNTQDFKILVVQGRVDLEGATTQVFTNYMIQPHPDKYEARSRIVGDQASTGVLANIVTWASKDAVADAIRKRYNV